MALSSTDTSFPPNRSEEHTSELQSLRHLVCRLLLEKKKMGEAQGQPRGRLRARGGGVSRRGRPPVPSAGRRAPHATTRSPPPPYSSFFFFLIARAPPNIPPLPHPAVFPS